MVFNPNLTLSENGYNYSLDLRSKLFEQRIILLDGEINVDLSTQIISQLIYLDSISNDDITIYINSPGGSINDGLAIYDTMNFIKSDVSTICIGMAASMGAFLLSCGKKGKRYILPNAEVMIHQPLGGASGQATEIEIAAKHILDIKKRMNKILASLTGQDLATIEKDTDRDNYMFADDALKYGIVDKILK